MNNTQKNFTINLHSRNADVTREDLIDFLNSLIGESEYSDDFTIDIEEDVRLNFNFLTSNIIAFTFFLRKSKEEFLKLFPHFAEEYDFCKSEFERDKQDAMLDLLESTSTEELTEPYGLAPDDFSYVVGNYVKDNLTEEEQLEFLKKVCSRSLKLEIY